MAKTDKELTAEIVIAYMAALDAKQSILSLKAESLPNVIQKIYDAIHALEQ